MRRGGGEVSPEVSGRGGGGGGAGAPAEVQRHQPHLCKQSLSAKYKVGLTRVEEHTRPKIFPKLGRTYRKQARLAAATQGSGLVPTVILEDL